MTHTEEKRINRWLLLLLGSLSTLSMGVVYAWSIFKVPLAETFGWTMSELSLNYSITMSLFCFGLLVGGVILRFLSARVAIWIGGTMAAAGFILTSINQGSLTMLYLTYALLSGTGIGIAYNTILSAVNSWFPDKKGLSSGTLMMGFGVSTLLFGNLAAYLFDLPSVGWRMTYLGIGLMLAIVLALAGLFIRFPNNNEIEPYLTSVKKKVLQTEDMDSKAMMRTSRFQIYFIYIIAVTAIGQSVFSFAKDLSLFVGTTTVLANLLVGVVSVFNGVGRVVFGLLFDRFGLRKTLLLSNLVTTSATVTTLLAILQSNTTFLILGLVLTGLSFSSAPTLTSTFTSSQFGTKYFPLNFSIVNTSGILSSMSAALMGSLYASTQSFLVPYYILVGLAVFAFILFGILQRQLKP